MTSWARPRCLAVPRHGWPALESRAVSSAAARWARPILDRRDRPSSRALQRVTWLLVGARCARDQIPARRVLLGARPAANWACGAPVLFLLPRFRHTLSSWIVAPRRRDNLTPFCARRRLPHVPYALDIAGAFPRTSFGEHRHFTWPSGSLSRARRQLRIGTSHSPSATYRRHMDRPAAPSICRILLDPVRYGYSWTTSSPLMLIGFAPMLVAQRQLARDLTLLQETTVGPPRH